MFTAVAERAYHEIVESFVVENGNGTLSYNGTGGVCSLNSTATYEVCSSKTGCQKIRSGSDGKDTDEVFL
jgi:hypothetical protein